MSVLICFKYLIWPINFKISVFTHVRKYGQQSFVLFDYGTGQIPKVKKA